LPRLQPGDRLILLDGTYTGDESMLLIEGSIAGTAEAPITISAQNDGRALIDGEGERRPVTLHDTEYIIVEGINACRSRRGVVNILRSNHCTVRRVCGWDAADGNTNIFGVHYGVHNLIEDCAGWGVARKTYSCSQEGNYTTFRRCWGRWEGCTNVGPKMTWTVSYNSHGTLVENCIGTWDALKMPETYVIHADGEPYVMPGTRFEKPVTMTDYAVDQPYGIFAIDRRHGPDVRLYGCIAYRLVGQRVSDYTANFSIARDEDSTAQMENCVSFIEPGAPSANNFRLIHVNARNLTAIGDTAGIFENSTMESMLVLEQPDSLIARHGNILRADDGAQVWYRYHDGQLTDEPLWPWPMNERILELTGVDVTRTVFELAEAACSRLLSSLEAASGRGCVRPSLTSGKYHQRYSISALGSITVAPENWKECFGSCRTY
jgi:hypothetical protein